MGILGRYYFFVGAVASCLILMCGAVAAQNDGRYLDRALPEAWEPDTLFVQKLPVEDRWWKELGDVRLDSLISVAVANNYDLLEAGDRIRQAHAGDAWGAGGVLPECGLYGGMDAAAEQPELVSDSDTGDKPDNAVCFG